MKRFFIKILSVLMVLLCLQSVLFVSSFASEVKSGDVDGDGKITAADAREILRISVGISRIKSISAADKDRNGKVNAEDARLVLLESMLILPEGAVFEGFTSKSFPVYKKDGLTFVDGILIANKTYSLPSSYNPGGLLKECTDAFSRMKSDAAKKGLNIYISSGFRSYETQRSIYNRYVSRDGKRMADTYSARPGHSEHQTGLSVDLNTITQSFANTAEGKWVAANCYKYGFIIRYPKGKSDITGYCYEPWHLRYVGKATAEKIFRSGLCLEEYFGITSAYNY